MFCVVVHFCILSVLLLEYLTNNFPIFAVSALALLLVIKWASGISLRFPWTLEICDHFWYRALPDCPEKVTQNDSCWQHCLCFLLQDHCVTTIY